VTLHHNLWEDCAERTPRVRFGRVHVANNLFVRRPRRITAIRSAGQALPHRERGQRVGSGPEIEETQLLRNWGGTQFHDRGSIANGRLWTSPPRCRRRPLRRAGRQPLRAAGFDGAARGGVAARVSGAARARVHR
jgi:hypothetical protein